MSEHDAVKGSPRMITKVPAGRPEPLFTPPAAADTAAAAAAAAADPLAVP